VTVWVRGDVPQEAGAALGRWLEECGDRPGALPAGVTRVQARLIRAVGRGELPGIGWAFVKVMGFPRAKDRLRYVHRALPGRHEARVLEAVATRAPGLPVPEVLAWSGSRFAGILPRMSALVTKGLDVDPSAPAPSLVERIGAARQLCEAGVEHRDLHPDNFVRLGDGRTAALDLQSAHIHAGPLGVRARLRVAAKLIESEGTDALEAVVAGGLLGAGERDALRRHAALLRVQTIDRRVRRCLQESTEFARSMGVAAVRHVRRGAPADAALVRLPARDALPLWIGDRVREVLDGDVPLLAGIVRPLVPHCGVRPALLLASGHAAARVEEARPALLAAFDRYRSLARSG
jgi:hypothetical protein